MVGNESNEEGRERGKGREKEDKMRKVITWLEVRAMKKEEKIVDIVDKYCTDDNNPIKNLRLKKEEKEERGERRKTKREKSLHGWK